MTTSLVTGAAGFIGFAVAKKLAERRNEHVILVDNFVRGERDDEFRALCSRPNVTFVEVDLSAPDAMDRLPAAKLDRLLHFAAMNGTQNFYEHPYEVLRHSTIPTFTLIDRYVKTGSVRRFVYAGSSESYAGTVTRFGWAVPTAEDVPLCIEDPTNPRWSYAVSKLHGEVLTCAACRQHHTSFTVIRYHNVYGPRMGDKHVIPDFCARMARGEYALYGYEDTRAFLYIDDAVDATLALTDAAAASDQIVHLGSPEEVTIQHLGQRMMRIAGIDAPIALNPAPKGSVRRRAPDVSKLRSLISFEPRWSLDNGLAETMAWYRAHLS